MIRFQTEGVLVDIDMIPDCDSFLMLNQSGKGSTTINHHGGVWVLRRVRVGCCSSHINGIVWLLLRRRVVPPPVSAPSAATATNNITHFVMFFACRFVMQQRESNQNTITLLLCHTIILFCRKRTVNRSLHFLFLVGLVINEIHFLVLQRLFLNLVSILTLGFYFWHKHRLES